VGLINPVDQNGVQSRRVLQSWAPKYIPPMFRRCCLTGDGKRRKMDLFLFTDKAHTSELKAQNNMGLERSIKLG
jgi:hypothetical protein